MIVFTQNNIKIAINIQDYVPSITFIKSANFTQESFTNSIEKAIEHIQANPSYYNLYGLTADHLKIAVIRLLDCFNEMLNNTKVDDLEEFLDNYIINNDFHGDIIEYLLIED